MTSVVILGIVQGLTEFLPISSSGHLSLVQAALGIREDPLALNVALHFGTLGALIWHYRKALLSFQFPGAENQGMTRMEGMGYVLLGIFPAAMVGLFFRDHIKVVSAIIPGTVSWMLLLTGSLLYSCRFVSGKETHPLTWRRAVLIGVCQVLALLPGVSRSGITIVTGLHAGLTRKDAANFSFIMAIPLLLGAFILEAGDLVNHFSGQLQAVSVGVVTSFLASLLALRCVVFLLQKEKFHYFAWYCWGLALFLFFIDTVVPSA